MTFDSSLSGGDFDSQFTTKTPYLIGIDEVGRGSLAGPLVCCAVSLKKDVFLKDLNDSKKLTAKKRNELFAIIIQNSLFVKIGMALSSEIDLLNIYQATLLAMQRTLSPLPPFFTPDNTTILVDAMPLKNPPFEVIPIIKGDCKSPHIMAASIIAKVTRDHLMEHFHNLYPLYHFDKHKGYGTVLHKKAIELYGSLPLHRKTFAPIRKLL